MAQQTAVEWFYNAIEKNPLLNLFTLYEQAKAMEKEQMFAYTKEKQIIGEHTEKFFTEDFERYYKQTYKTE
jgi:hypothetical protein